MYKKITVLVFSLLVSLSANALSPVYTALFSDLAIKGYDTVAYFSENKAVKGNKQISYEYQQATWLFSSQENKQMFIKNPEKYAPQYGGYCAYAVSQNTTASIQPELFTIHEGKLYLNYSAKVNNTWLADKIEYINAADKNWPNLLAQ